MMDLETAIRSALDDAIRSIDAKEYVQATTRLRSSLIWTKARYKTLTKEWMSGAERAWDKVFNSVPFVYERDHTKGNHLASLTCAIGSEIDGVAALKRRDYSRALDEAKRALHYMKELEARPT